jgi:nucleoside-diphosphate-sugar epimerase
MELLITGASGFVGQAILKEAMYRGVQVRPVFRSQASANDLPEAVILPGQDCAADWSKALHGIDVVIHAAARTHVMREAALDPLAEYLRVNTQGTLKLAYQAARAGVRRFVFISSIKVNGEETVHFCPLNAYDSPNPEDAYAISKAEAETGLRLIAEETGMEVTIIRPPLIYGQGVKGNFASLIRMVRWGVPLPLGGVTHNRRSFVGLDNLVDLIFVCTEHPKAANQTFLVSDGEDLSTTELLRRIGEALRHPARLVVVPPVAIAFMANLLGSKRISQRLLGSLQVDIQKTCDLLQWKPSVTVDEGLRRAVE